MRWGFSSENLQWRCIFWLFAPVSLETFRSPYVLEFQVSCYPESKSVALQKKIVSQQVAGSQAQIGLMSAQTDLRKREKAIASQYLRGVFLYRVCYCRTWETASAGIVNGD